MRLNAVRSAYNKYCIVKYFEHTLGFRRKIHVSGSIKQIDFQIPDIKYGLPCENRYTSFTFEGMGIQGRVAVINTTQFSYFARFIKQGFRKCGLTRINMGNNTHNDFFH